MSGLNSQKLQAIKPPHIRQLLDDLAAQGIAPSSQRKVLERLKVIFREAARLELIYRNPAEFIEVEAPASEPRGRTLEPWEIAKLLEACETHPMGLLFRLLLGCGLRKGEAPGPDLGGR
jgi:site-specific recombinase XerD